MKKKLATKMQTRRERLTKGEEGSPFNSKAWVERAKKRRLKEVNKRK